MSQTQFNATEVANYLQENPEFFSQHLHLLETLTIPHPTSGNAISLVAKQLEIFRNKQSHLEQQLSSLLDIARENHASMSRIHQLTLTLLEAKTLTALVNNLYQALTSYFFTDFVTLRIIQEQPNDNVPENLFISPKAKNIHYLTSQLIDSRPRCAQLSRAQARFLFAEFAPQIRSCAIIPLCSANLSALLVIASRDPNRFHPSMGNFFLSQISDIVTTRLAFFLA